MVALRSQTLAGVAGGGAMASVLLAADELRPGWRVGTALSIAAVNGPAQTIVSGEPAALERVHRGLHPDGIHIRSIAVDYASHCAQVEPLRECLVDQLAGLSPRAARVPLYSTVASVFTGEPLDTTTMDADYWYANLREPVRFYDGVAGLLAAGGEYTFVELSAHPVLAPAIADTLAGAPARSGSVVVPVLRRDRPDLEMVAGALAQLHTYGHSPSWPALYPHASVVGLATYPFEHHRYWLAPTPAADVGAAGLVRAEHPLLGARTELADQDQIMLSGRLSITTLGWLAGHQVHDRVVLPATGFIEMVLHAGELVGCPVIDELILHTPLILSEHVPTDVQIMVHPAEAVQAGGRRGVSVHARTGQEACAGWVLHASATLSADQPARHTRQPGAGGSAGHRPRRLLHAARRAGLWL